TAKKFNLSTFSVRYLSGHYPWLYIQVNVIDGNGQGVNRAWNNNGNWITGDGAGRDVDNTINLSVPGGYAPVMGRNNSVEFEISVKEVPSPNFWSSGACYAHPFWVIVTPF